MSMLRLFLCMTGYFARYIKDYATVSAPLRQLTKQKVEFKWSPECEKSFSSIKEGIEMATVMAYFDAILHTEVTVDASPAGLGAVLAQHAKGLESPWQVVVYAS